MPAEQQSLRSVGVDGMTKVEVDGLRVRAAGLEADAAVAAAVLRVLDNVSGIAEAAAVSAIVEPVREALAEVARLRTEQAANVSATIAACIRAGVDK